MNLSASILFSTIILCVTIALCVTWLLKSLKTIIKTIFEDIRKLEKYINVHVEKTVDVTVKADDNQDSSNHCQS